MGARGIRPVRLDLTSEERTTLERWTRGHHTAQALALRARIVLACAAQPDVAHGTVAAALGVTRGTVGLWRQRFAAQRLAGLQDAARSGAPRRIGDRDVERAIATTLEQMPTDATHWSTRGLARRVGLSATTVGRIWRAFGLQPQRSETLKLSTDPLFVEKVRDIVGLYLNPPARALVLSVDETPQIQATEGTAPVVPMRPDQPERHPHDYIRHGTRDLFAALDVTAGTVIGEVHARHRSEEFRHFLDTVEARTPPELDLHLILDNSATHKTATIQHWVLAHPRVHLHFTPTSSSWINLVECWFSLLQRRALARAEFTSPDALEAALHADIAATNAAPSPSSGRRALRRSLPQSPVSVAALRKRTTRANLGAYSRLIFRNLCKSVQICG